VNLLDLIIIAAAIGASVGGYRIGFLTRAASWIGMGLGLYLAARLLPTIVEALEGSAPMGVFFVAVLVLVGGAFLGQALGLLIGSKLHLALPRGQARTADRVGGAVAGVVGVLIAVWLLTPIGSSIARWPAEQVRNSAIAKGIDSVFPAPPDAVRTLRQLIGEDRFPLVFEALRPAPDLGAPPASSGLTEETARAVAASTVKVEARACGRLQDGSGSVMEAGMIVTNAHVVAGAEEVDVFRGDDGARLDAVVVAFDPNRDVAVLRVSDINRPPLALDDTRVGGRGAVFGYPGGGPLAISPFEVGEEIPAQGTDIYDERPSRRQVLVLSAELRPGDSGGPLVDPDGEVVGLAFAIAPDRPNVAYALTIEEVEAVLGGDLSQTVSAGSCLG
jgi:S1-C subfamily serine protease